MNSKLFIAEKVKIGFNPREDTYTGKLGYVIGYDGKKWRKEPSWESWRYQYIEDAEFEAKKLVNYNQRVAQMTQNHEYYTKLVKENPKDYGSSWYLDMVSKPVEQYINETVGPYDKFVPNLGKVSGDKNMIPLEFDNVPTEGFVLNKKAGGYSSGWNHRSTYCRVYDPRGFEFEISIPNLLFILQECNAMRGKGLEGAFVYAWDGKDLVLLPTTSEDYTYSTKFTKAQSGKVGVKDLVEGYTYKTKGMDDYIYLGKFNWLEQKYEYTECKKRHVFCSVKNNNFLGVESLTNFSSVVSDTPVSNYAELLDKYNASDYCGILKDVQIEDAEIVETVSCWRMKDGMHIFSAVITTDDNKFEIYNVTGDVDYNGRRYSNNYGVKNYTLKSKSILTLKDNGDFEIKSMKPKVFEKITLNEIKTLNLKHLTMNKNNKKEIIQF